MNLRTGHKLIELARSMRPQKSTGQFFHISAILRKNRIVSIGWNNYLKSHPSRRFGHYADYKGFGGDFRASLHSEISAIIKLGEEDLSGFSMINIRIGNFNQVCMSRCCPNCFRVLRDTGLDTLYFTNQLGQFEELEIN